MTSLSWEERVRLAEDFAPRLVLFPEEKELGRPQERGGGGDYHPRSLDLLLERGRLYPGTLRSLAQLKIAWLFDHASRLPATLENLARSRHPNDQIRLLGPPIPGPDQAWQTYFEILDGVDSHGRSGRERFPLTTYVRVQTRAEALAACAREKIEFDATKMGRPFYRPETAREDDVAIQYWFCYYFNDWANIHEADWEGISIFLRHGSDARWEPLGATYYVHENGMRRHWAEVETWPSGNSHPVVYVASGSHASYFQYSATGHEAAVQGPILPVLRLKLKLSIASERMDFVPERDDQRPPLEPRVEVLPDPIGPSDRNDPTWQHEQWLSYRGSWGARELGRLIAGGPVGPRCKGLQWHNPFAWSEIETWPDYLVY